MEDQEEHNDVMGKALTATVLVACGTEDGLNRFLVQLCNSNLSDVSFAFLVAFHCDHSSICRFDASPFEYHAAKYRNITCHSASGSVDRLVGDFPRSTLPQSHTKARMEAPAVLKQSHFHVGSTALSDIGRDEAVCK